MHLPQHSTRSAHLEVRWALPPRLQAKKIRGLAAELKLPLSIAQLLLQRGFEEGQSAKLFLQPRLRQLSDPFLLPDMPKAVDRLIAAIKKRERLVIYGDYDVDGVTSLAIISRVLKDYGVQAPCFLPNRMEEGYGLSADGAAHCVATYHPQLLISVDCGTASAKEIAQLQESGIDVIVLDHHALKEPLPECCALVNPKCGTDFHYLCAAAIAFKLCHALLKVFPNPKVELKHLLDLVALGTVADLAPLVGENRIFVKAGLLQMAATHWAGLRSLMEIANSSARTTSLKARFLGFQIGPRLNAAGRLGTARAALDLLLTDDQEQGQHLAKELDNQNRSRQVIECTTFNEAVDQLGTDFIQKPEVAIVLGNTGWHLGVLGIVAARISKKFHRPTLIISFAEDGQGKGSGRSICGLPLVDALAECRDLLETFGGHDMAAGFSLRLERLPEFSNRFKQVAKGYLTPEALQPKLNIDAEISLAELELSFLLYYEALEPFGIDNAQPLFLCRNVHPIGQPTLLKGGQHLRLEIAQGETRRQAMLFDSPEFELPLPPWDIAFSISRNTFRGRSSLQITIQAIRQAEHHRVHL